jgi:hypothetical protein
MNAKFKGCVYYETESIRLRQREIPRAAAMVIKEACKEGERFAPLMGPMLRTYQSTNLSLLLRNSSICRGYTKLKSIW